jgi:hypothetical protein
MEWTWNALSAKRVNGRARTKPLTYLMPRRVNRSKKVSAGYYTYWQFLTLYL